MGILQVGPLTIEILPKIDKTIESTATWQKVLINMLQYCRLLQPETAGIGRVTWTSSAILDLFLYQFLEEVKAFLQKGLIKEYIAKEKNNHQLKGQLLMPKHLRHNLSHPARFYTKQQLFEEAHLLNQIISEALKVLQQLNLSTALQASLQEVIAHFPPLPAYQWQAQDFEILLQDPTYRSYQSTIELARLILLNFSADIRYGSHHLFALLFDMNVLFEEYIFRQLQQQVGKTLQISRQRSIPFWRRRNIRPDIVVNYQQEKYIIDTKWKILLPHSPSPTIEDLKQLYIYCRYFKATKGILLFPTSKATHNTTAQPFLDETKDISCQLVLVNIIDKQGKLKQGLGKELLGVWK